MKIDQKIKKKKKIQTQQKRRKGRTRSRRRKREKIPMAIQSMSQTKKIKVHCAFNTTPFLLNHKINIQNIYFTHTHTQHICKTTKCAAVFTHTFLFSTFEWHHYAFGLYACAYVYIRVIVYRVCSSFSIVFYSWFPPTFTSFFFIFRNFVLVNVECWLVGMHLYWVTVLVSNI